MRVAAYCVLAAAIVVVLVVLGVATAEAQTRANCAPRESALAQLAEKWGETRRSVMLANGRVFEVYAAESGTWTILRTTPDGLSCIVASGVAYEQVKALTGDPA